MTNVHSSQTTSPRFLCHSTAFFRLAGAVGRQRAPMALASRKKSRQTAEESRTIKLHDHINLLTHVTVHPIYSERF
jgi:hypothetical protein